MRYYAQLGQDRYILENYFKSRRGGFFVEIGAYDGETYSNTLTLEESFDWKGICIEPIPEIYAKLQKRRQAECLNLAISDFTGEAEFLNVDVVQDQKMLSGLVENYDPRHVKRIEGSRVQETKIKVRVQTLNEIVKQRGIQKIDYLSIDTEGSEIKILEAFDWSLAEIDLLSIENNYREQHLRDFMLAKGYELIHVFHGYDELYRRKGVKKLPTTTVFCAVWHQDPYKEALLKGHQECLDRLTVPVERVYIFDADDRPPQELSGTKVCVNQPLSIYEAWNVALSLARTPFVMNLNLDDRLNSDAVRICEAYLNEGYDLVGGDWKITYSQTETDLVGECVPVQNLPCLSDWPPVKGSLTRLGSGDGSRSIYGPACAWRTEIHKELGRYPYRFGDFSPIRVIGDVCFFAILQQMNKKLVRAPYILGNYHSHPSEQAEFRNRDSEEQIHVNRFGVSFV